jgi:hypothetical protein
MIIDVKNNKLEIEKTKEIISFNDFIFKKEIINKALNDKLQEEMKKANLIDDVENKLKKIYNLSNNIESNTRNNFENIKFLKKKLYQAALEENVKFINNE